MNRRRCNRQCHVDMHGHSGSTTARTRVQVKDEERNDRTTVRTAARMVERASESTLTIKCSETEGPLSLWMGRRGCCPQGQEKAQGVSRSDQAAATLAGEDAAH